MNGGAGEKMGRRSRFRIRTILLAALVVVAGLQLVPVDRTNPPVVSEPLVEPAVQALLQRACFDCHSNRTRWPWYSRVAPVSWLVAHHVEEGRGQLNFSTWPLFDLEAQEHLLREVVDEVSEGAMPPGSYTLVHKDARLTDAERQQLLAWARGS